MPAEMLKKQHEELKTDAKFLEQIEEVEEIDDELEV